MPEVLSDIPVTLIWLQHEILLHIVKIMFASLPINSPDRYKNVHFSKETAHTSIRVSEDLDQ